jgi:hypothetical protein
MMIIMVGCYSKAVKRKNLSLLLVSLAVGIKRLAARIKLQARNLENIIALFNVHSCCLMWKRRNRSFRVGEGLLLMREEDVFLLYSKQKLLFTIYNTTLLVSLVGRVAF